MATFYLTTLAFTRGILQFEGEALKPVEGQPVYVRGADGLIGLLKRDVFESVEEAQADCRGRLDARISSLQRAVEREKARSSEFAVNPYAPGK
jgi:hypothetical protein